MGKFAGHLRSNVVAYLALAVALGGTGAWAADKVGSKQIKRNAFARSTSKTDRYAPRTQTGASLRRRATRLRTGRSPAGPTIVIVDTG